MAEKGEPDECFGPPASDIPTVDFDVRIRRVQDAGGLLIESCDVVWSASVLQGIVSSWKLSTAKRMWRIWKVSETVECAFRSEVAESDHSCEGYRCHQDPL